MTQKNSEKKAARELQRAYACSYQTALNLLRRDGYEKTKAQLEAEAKAADAELRAKGLK